MKDDLIFYLSGVLYTCFGYLTGSMALIILAVINFIGFLIFVGMDIKRLKNAS